MGMSEIIVRVLFTLVAMLPIFFLLKRWWLVGLRCRHCRRRSLDLLYSIPVREVLSPRPRIHRACAVKYGVGKKDVVA